MAENEGWFSLKATRISGGKLPKLPLPSMTTQVGGDYLIILYHSRESSRKLIRAVAVMASRISKRSLAALRLHPGAGYLYVGPSRTRAREYAVSTMKQKQQNPSTSAPASKSSVKGHASQASVATDSPSAVIPHSRRKNKKLVGGVSYRVPEKEDTTKTTMNEEEALAQIEQISAMARLFPSADPWGQRVETLGE